MLAAGTSLGPYKILAPIGAGGMGEVYRARDTRLGRDVAIKVIPTELARDPERIKRFEQEARAAGALSHPNVCAIYDVGTHDGAPYVVEELLEGESLRARLEAGAIPWRKALDYVAQAAQGLAAAHAKGIVHRDLKPENLFVLKDGRVKVLDFGLAKLTRPDVLAPSGEPTISIAGTETGAILGTVGYMSPEQVLGQPADARSDLFALGTILYELLSGKRAFAGASYVETLHAILNAEPAPLVASGREVPPAVEPIVRHCLEKAPGERYQSASDLAFALQSVSGTGAMPIARAPVAGRWRAAVLALSVVAVAAVAAVYVVGERRVKQAVPAYQRVTFRRGSVTSARFTPDGQAVVYSARSVGDESAKLYVQRLGTADARPLEMSGMVAGVAGGEMAIVQGNALSRMPIEGGTARDLADGIKSADWSADGSKFVVVRLGEGGQGQQLECPIGRVLYKTGGISEIIRPRLSPAGDRVAYIWEPNSGWNAGQVEVVDLKGQRQVLSKGWVSLLSLAWSPDGREVWFTGTRKGVTEALHAVTLEGKERILLRTPGSLRLQDVARDGRILLAQVQGVWEVRGRMAGDSAERDYSWLDGTIGPRLTLNGRQMLFHEMGEGGGTSPAYTSYLWRNDGKPPIRLCEGWGYDLSRDGRWVLVGLGSESLGGYAGRNTEFRLVPTGAGEARALARGSIVEHHGGFFAPDGKRAIITGAEAGKPPRLWLQELPDGTPRPFGPDSTVGVGPFSADGRWLAIYPQDPKAAWQLHPIDGGPPRAVPWARADEALYAWSDDGRWFFVGRPAGTFPIEVTRIDTRSGQRQTWLRVAPQDLAGARSGYLSALTPDGRYYAYNYARSLSDLYLVTGVR